MENCILVFSLQPLWYHLVENNWQIVLAMIAIGQRKERKKKELPNMPTNELCSLLIGNCVHFLPPLSLPTAGLARVWSGVGEG